MLGIGLIVCAMVPLQLLGALFAPPKKEEMHPAQIMGVAAVGLATLAAIIVLLRSWWTV